jgi:hypothetical protein
MARSYGFQTAYGNCVTDKLFESYGNLHIFGLGKQILYNLGAHLHIQIPMFFCTILEMNFKLVYGEILNFYKRTFVYSFCWGEISFPRMIFLFSVNNHA